MGKLVKTLFKFSLIVLFFGQTACSVQQRQQVANGDTLAFKTIFEPSGIVYLGENEFLLVEDEPESPFHRVVLDTPGRIQELGKVQIQRPGLTLNDLEGISYDGKYVYAVTSHSTDNKSEISRDRAVLARFEYQDGVLFEARVIRDLKQMLVLKLWPVLSNLSLNKISEKINIEALAWSPSERSLLLGFRSPLVDDKSLVVRLESLDLLFTEQSAKNAQITLNWLALDNNRIRAMSWDVKQQQFLIVTGRKRSGKSDYALWGWPGRAGGSPAKIPHAESTLPARTEGLSTFMNESTGGALIVIDDGSKKKNSPGHYQFILVDENPF